MGSSTCMELYRGVLDADHQVCTQTSVSTWSGSRRSPTQKSWQFLLRDHITCDQSLDIHCIGPWFLESQDNIQWYTKEVTRVNCRTFLKGRIVDKIWKSYTVCVIWLYVVGYYSNISKQELIIHLMFSFRKSFSLLNIFQNLCHALLMFRAITVNSSHYELLSFKILLTDFESRWFS